MNEALAAAEKLEKQAELRTWLADKDPLEPTARLDKDSRTGWLKTYYGCNTVSHKSAMLRPLWYLLWQAPL